MYISSRVVLVRNISVSIVNGIITLIILLIAPLGLAAVISNTFLVTIASYAAATAADRVIAFLNPSRQQAELLHRSRQSQIRRYDDLEQR